MVLLSLPLLHVDGAMFFNKTMVGSVAGRAPTAEAVLPVLLSHAQGTVSDDAEPVPSSIDWATARKRIATRVSEDLTQVVTNSYSLWVPVNCVYAHNIQPLSEICIKLFLLVITFECWMSDAATSSSRRQNIVSS